MAEPAATCSRVTAHRKYNALLGLITWRLRCVLLLCIVSAGPHGSPARAQTLSRGHQIILSRGLQIQAQVFPADNGHQFDFARWADSNFTTVNLHWHGNAVTYLGPAPGLPWGRWLGNSTDDLSSTEMQYESNMVSCQYLDEQDLTAPGAIEECAGVFSRFRSEHPNVMVFVNMEADDPDDSTMRMYLSTAQPDMIMFDNYPFYGENWQWATSRRTYFYNSIARYRSFALGGCDGTGATPIPFGGYTQVFTGPYWPYTPSESEIRLNNFLLWTAGAKFVSAFVYNQTDDASIHTVLFSGIGESSPTAAYYQQKETNRQSRNLGESLIRLLTTGFYIVSGESSERPSNVPAFGFGKIPYLISVSAVNIGTKNGGHRGDVALGKFKVLDESFDGPDFSDETYFMVLNGLCAPDSTCAETRQTITLTFNFATSGITSLQRLNRDTGNVEVVPLTDLGGGHYKLDLTLDGGTADLFKFNTGAPFVCKLPIGGVVIDAGATYATTASVALALWANSVHTPIDMRFSNDNASWSSWEPFAASKTWQLSPGDGGKTVYAQFRDSLGNISETCADSIVLDMMPPTVPGVPSDAGAYTQSTALAFDWTASTDSGSGIKCYNCRIGSAPGGCDVFDGQSGIPPTTSKSVTAPHGGRYYCRVQAADNLGNTSEWSPSSDGIAVVDSIASSAGSLKQLPDGASVGLSAQKVTAVFAGCFYIGDTDAPSGMKVVPDLMPSGLGVDSVVDIGGTMCVANGERYVAGCVSARNW